MRWIVAVGLLWVGCSSLFMEKPPKRWNPPQEVDCTASTGFVSWDVLNVVGHLVSGTLLLVTSSELPDSSDEKDMLRLYAAGNGVMALAHITSAVKGSGWARRCKELRLRRDAWVKARATEADAAPPDADPADGTLGGPCYGNGTCNADLTCDTAINRCTMRVGVDAATDAGAPADAGVDATGP